MIAAYRQPDGTHGRQLMQRLITSVAHGVPAALSEVITLGRTLTKRANDVLAYFDRPGTSNGPTEAINGRLATVRLFVSATGARPRHAVLQPSFGHCSTRPNRGSPLWARRTLRSWASGAAAA